MRLRPEGSGHPGDPAQRGGAEEIPEAAQRVCGGEARAGRRRERALERKQKGPSAFEQWCEGTSITREGESERGTIEESYLLCLLQIVLFLGFDRSHHGAAL
jgi:hypothetical protein